MIYDIKYDILTYYLNSAVRKEIRFAKQHKGLENILDK